MYNAPVYRYPLIDVGAILTHGKFRSDLDDVVKRACDVGGCCHSCSRSGINFIFLATLFTFLIRIKSRSGTENNCIAGPFH